MCITMRMLSGGSMSVFDGLNTGKTRGEKNAECHCNHWLCWKTIR